MARKIFLLASMSCDAKCQWPIVTPVALYGAGCATAPVTVSADATSRAENSFVFMDPSLVGQVFGPAVRPLAAPRVNLSRRRDGQNGDRARARWEAAALPQK